jgi:hypothetical protein
MGLGCNFGFRVTGSPSGPASLQRKQVARTRDGGIQIALDVFDCNRAVADFCSYAAELIFYASWAVKIPEKYNHSADIVNAINCYVINSDTHAPFDVLAHCICDTEVPGKNLNGHIYSCSIL